MPHFQYHPLPSLEVVEQDEATYRGVALVSYRCRAAVYTASPLRAFALCKPAAGVVQGLFLAPVACRTSDLEADDTKQLLAMTAT